MKVIMKRFFRKIFAMFSCVNATDMITIDENGFWVNRKYPSNSIKKTAKIFNELNGEIIIEIGTGLHGEMAGNSMLVWPLKTKATRIIAVDLDQNRLDEVRKATSPYAHVETILTDGIEFLKRFPTKIDLLYLDFWTPDPVGSLPGTGRAEAYRAAYIAARDKMNDHSLILIDDTDHIHPWKHTYIIPEARKDGFEVLYTGRQSLLKR